MAELRLEERDDYMHAVDGAETFNESMYFNAYDPRAALGGFFRIGNRPNEGFAEMTICLYVPDGRVGFMFSRPAIASNERFDAGGMRFEVAEPMRRQRVLYDGDVALLSDPLAMADPKRAFAESPWAKCSVALDYTAVSPAHGGEAPQGDAFLGDFARGHYVQHVAARGRVIAGDDEWTIDGFGLRDHSWGARSWQSPWWYRWLTANAGAEAGFLISVVGARDGVRRVGGVMLRDGAYTPIDDVKIETEWEGADAHHRALRVEVRAGREEHRIEGRVLSLIPLRHRATTREGEHLLTRITEGLTEWRWDGRVGYGLSEYLDQIVDGRPAGAGA